MKRRGAGLGEQVVDVDLYVSEANESALTRNAPMFRSRTSKGRGVGLARGRATVNRARGQQRGGGGGGRG